MFKYTPAPWQYYKQPITNKENAHIVQRGNSGGFQVMGDNAGSDASLIAAAPEMYEILRTLIMFKLVMPEAKKMIADINNTLSKLKASPDVNEAENADGI